MRFSKLHLENWRNFTYVDVPLQQRVFLIGANATGKSNLLDVFRFLHDIVRVGGGFEKAIEDRGGVARLHSLFSSDTAHIVIDAWIEDDNGQLWRYRLAFTQDTTVSPRPLLQEEKVWHSDILLLDRPDAEDTHDSALLRQTSLEQTFANRRFREVADFFNSIRYYHIVPQIVREPERSIGKTSDPYGSDFIEQVAKLPLESQKALLRTIEDMLRAVIPQFRELLIRPDERGVMHMFGLFETKQPRLEFQSESGFSDGTIRLIGLIRALLDGYGPLLLEEPELSLHQAVVRYLPGMMWSIQKQHNRQILVSTHSSDFLQDEGIAADEIVLLQPSMKDGSTQVTNAAEIATIKQLLDAGLSAADAALPEIQLPNTQKLLHLGETYNAG